MQLYDAGGNGWNGATWSLVNGLGATVSTGTLSSGSNDAVAVPVGSTGPCTVPQVITASDCPQAVNVCTDLNFTIDPNGWGSVFEIPALGTTSNPDYLWSDAVNSPWGTDHYGCLRGQEINTTWMIVNISGSGSLEFTLGANGSQTGFYDWTMFLYTATTCDLILSNTISPIRCNWNFASYGGTGLVSAIPPGGVPENFEPPLNVLAGQRFLICFSNWSSVTSVVPLVFGGTATVSCDPVILPVELIDLGVAQNAYGSDVHWITATEHNTSHYVVERSVDLWSWVEVGRVTANGSTTQAHHYHLLDPSPMEGDSYYRLRIVDMDGSATTSWIVTARWESPLLRVWPDPSDGEVSITLKEHAEKAVIHVIDDLGRETRFERSASAPDVIRLRLLGAPSGVYSIRVIDGDWQGSGSLIIDAR